MSPFAMKLFILFFVALFNFSFDVKSQKMTLEEYQEIGMYIWKTYVPKSGQAQTEQGELLRAIEKLADEAQRNGNINFNAKCHGLLISYLRKYLTDEKVFDKKTIEQIIKDLDTISDRKKPYLEEDLYDRLRERIFDWYLKNKEPIPNAENPKLYC
jgi:ASC-1-like (ASCH) protein